MSKRSKNSKTAQVPRQMADIQTEYQQLSAAAANAQYLRFVKDEELRQINNRLVEINVEAAARQKLDAEVQAELAKKEASEATQSGAV